MKVHYTHSYLLNPEHTITVNLIGAGGTGSQVLTCLTRLNEALRSFDHPGLHVYCYDGDVVSEANIGRQLFSPSDVGVNKAICLISRINRFFGYEWEACPYFYEGQTAKNITISCVDTAETRIKISHHLKSVPRSQEPTDVSLYWLDFGNSLKTGQVVLGTCQNIKQPKSEYTVSARLKNVIEKFPQLKTIVEADQGPSCSLAEALNKQDLFINPSLAQLGMNILWKLFREGMITHHGLYLNLDTMLVNPIKI